MTELPELNLRSSLALNFKILCVFGHWPPENNPESLFFYKIYRTIFLGFFFIIYVITEAINIALSFGDLEKITDASFLFLTHTAQIFKLYCLVKNNIRIQKLANDLNRELFKPRNEKQYHMVKKAMDNSKLFYVIFLTMSISTIILWCAFPFIDAGINEINLPLSAWYPFSTNGSIRFAIVYAYQIISVLIDATCNVSMDTIATGFMAHICGQLDVLNDSLLYIQQQSVQNLTTKQEQNNSVEVYKKYYEKENVSKQLQDEMDKEQIRCIEHHLNVIE